MNMFTWLKEIVYSGTVSNSSLANIAFVIFGCALVIMTVGFIFKFLLKLMD